MFFFFQLFEFDVFVQMNLVDGRFESSSKIDISHNFVECVRCGQIVQVAAVKIDDSRCNGRVNNFITLVNQNEEQIESWHDRGWHHQVVFQRLGPVVTAADWVRGRENRRASV